MIGLPARGKSYIAKKIARYLQWLGYTSRIFNLGQYRREVVGANTPAEFFDPMNEKGADARRIMAEHAVDDVIDYFRNGGGQAAIYDATNSSVERRNMVRQRLKESGLSYELIWVESICEDDRIIAKTIRDTKRFSPDYQGKSDAYVWEDFTKRIENYRRQYVTVTDEECSSDSYIKIYDAGRKIETMGIRGYLPTRLVFFLMNLQISRAPIYFTMPISNELHPVARYYHSAVQQSSREAVISELRRLAGLSAFDSQDLEALVAESCQTQTTTSASAPSQSRLPAIPAESSLSTLNPSPGSSATTSPTVSSSSLPGSHASLASTSVFAQASAYGTTMMATLRTQAAKTFSQEDNESVDVGIRLKFEPRLDEHGIMFAKAVARFVFQDLLEEQKQIKSENEADGIHTSTGDLQAGVLHVWSGTSSLTKSTAQIVADSITDTNVIYHKLRRLERKLANARAKLTHYRSTKSADDPELQSLADQCERGDRVLARYQAILPDFVREFGVPSVRLVNWRAFSDINRGIYDGVTSDMLRHLDPAASVARRKDKLNFKFAQGESYKDVIDRAERVIFELERQDAPVIVIAQRAVLRCLLGYFVEFRVQDIPWIDIPPNCVIKITPLAYGNKIEIMQLVETGEDGACRVLETPKVVGTTLKLRSDAPGRCADGDQVKAGTKSDKDETSCDRYLGLGSQEMVGDSIHVVKARLANLRLPGDDASARTAETANAPKDQQ